MSEYRFRKLYPLTLRRAAKRWLKVSVVWAVFILIVVLVGHVLSDNPLPPTYALTFLAILMGLHGLHLDAERASFVREVLDKFYGLVSERYASLYRHRTKAWEVYEERQARNLNIGEDEWRSNPILGRPIEEVLYREAVETVLADEHFRYALLWDPDELKRAEFPGFCAR